MKRIYSVLTCNFGNYEIVREVRNPNPNVEYILVTDDHNLKSDTWTIVYEDFLKDYTAYAASWYVKSHPFEFVNTDTVLWIDGSINILDDPTDELMKPFISCDAELGEVLNIVTTDPREEILRWGEAGFHGYDMRHARRILDFLPSDMNDGLVQTTIYMCKNTQNVLRVNNRWWELLVRYGEYPQVDQQSMSLRSYCIRKYMWRSPKLLLLSPTTLFCHSFDYCYHGTDVSQYPAFKETSFPDDPNFPLNWIYPFHNSMVQPKVLKGRDE